jgi:hypothetical protein
MQNPCQTTGTYSELYEAFREQKETICGKDKIRLKQTGKDFESEVIIAITGARGSVAGCGIMLQAGSSSSIPDEVTGFFN